MAPGSLRALARRSWAEVSFAEEGRERERTREMMRSKGIDKKKLNLNFPPPAFSLSTTHHARRARGDSRSSGGASPQRQQRRLQVLPLIPPRKSLQSPSRSAPPARSPSSRWPLRSSPTCRSCPISSARTRRRCRWGMASPSRASGAAFIGVWLPRACPGIGGEAERALLFLLLLVLAPGRRRSGTCGA